MRPSNIQILILRLAIAGLFLHLGIDKYREGWLASPEHLASSLNNYHQRASGMQLIYLDNVALPYVNLWSRLIMLGEFAVGVSLALGLLVRFSSAIAIFMVASFHAANGNLYTLSLFGSPWAALLIAGLVVTFLSCAGRWAGIDAMLAKLNAKAILW
jgi:uncharacterized membrane protein YphA (DoxX/SURF4 family)